MSTYNMLIKTYFTIFQVLFDGKQGNSTFYFLRFARVITSFFCTWFLRKLAPTLYTNIYWVQANIMSIGKSGAWVQLPVITLGKPRKYFNIFQISMKVALAKIKSGSALIRFGTIFSTHVFFKRRRFASIFSSGSK